MFTGIIEKIGQVSKITTDGSNFNFTIKSPISNLLKIDQSVSHNGVCLTVVELHENSHVVTAIEETLNKTNLKELNVGSKVNLERCTKIGDRLDGHIVQGHVDGLAICKQIQNRNGSWEFTFDGEKEIEILTVNKGSISINGVSLTVVETKGQQFSVAIIPYTFENTIFNEIKVGDSVNIEYDIIGKYVMKKHSQQIPL
ncbi:riboflavin synthase [Flavobacteriales bacterium]|nr:riboflavin synthase [Flavobacteriales bacterium]